MQQAWGWGNLKKGQGARTPSAGIFRSYLSQQHTHTHTPASVSKSPASSASPPIHTHTSTPQHPLLSRACRRRSSQAQPEPGTPPRLPFPPTSPSAHPGRAPQGDPGAPRQSFGPHPALLFRRGVQPGSETRKVLSPLAMSTCPSDPCALSGQLAANSALQAPIEPWGRCGAKGGLETGGLGDSEDGGRRLCRGHKST